MLKLAFKFVRLKILTTCYLIVLLGSLSAGSFSMKSLLAMFVLIAWYIHAASSNDYADRKIDAINLKGAKDRPLVTKSLSFRKLWTIHYVAGVIALMLSSYYGLQGVILTAIVLALDYAYSFRPFRITDRGALSQLMLPIAYAYYPFSLGYWSTATDNPYPWLLVTGLYIGFVARLFLKDFRDVKGDSKFGKRTFLLRHGRRVTCLASELFGVASLILLSFAVSFSAGVVLVLVVGHMAALILLMKLAETHEVKLQMRLIATLAKIANISVATLLAYFFGKNYLNSAWLNLLLPAIVGLVMLLLTWRGYKYGAKTKLA
jgi:4-hydroxybenzoate polyprenyltransferase